MRILRSIRFSMGAVMMLVLAAAAGSALYAKALSYSIVIPDLGWKTDVPILFLLAIGLTAVTLGAWKDHPFTLTMLQFSLACVGCLSLIWIVESGWERGVRYWYQTSFAATVTLPIVARSYVKTRIPRGPRRDRYKRVFEAIFFSYLNVMLVSIGVLLQGLVYLTGQGALSVANPAGAAVPVPATPASPARPAAKKSSLPPQGPTPLTSEPLVLPAPLTEPEP